MKLNVLLIFTALSAIAIAWTPQDREIFALRDSVEKDIGQDTTFYSWLGVENTATDNQIARAYRKLSQKIHPDKNPGKKATERFARLGLVTKVLRSEGRDRYDFFLKNGFPKWKGTDYYYSRYRPGLGTVSVFLFLLISGAQYLVLKLTASQHRKHMTSVIDEVKSAAWGNGVHSSARKVTLDNGKQFMVYPEGSVFLVENSKEYYLSLDTIVDPTWKSTILYTLPMRIYSKVSGKPMPLDPEADGRVLEEEGPEQKEKKVKQPKPASKVGGSRRRK